MFQFLNQIREIKSSLIHFINIYVFPLHTKYIKNYSFENTTNINEAFDYRVNPPITLQKELHASFKKKNKIHYAKLFIVEADQAKVWGNQGAVISKDNFFFESVSREYHLSGKQHSIFKQTKLSKLIPIEKTLAVVATSGSEVYYHWMLDLVPRILMLKKFGFLEKVDSIIFNYHNLPFQNEVLNKLKISKEKILNSKNHWQFHISAPLIIPSLVSPNNCPSPWAIKAIKNLFLEKINKTEKQKRLYIQRKSGREIINEKEVLSVLNHYDFEVLNPELYSVQEQANLFSNASFVIGAHGAGLTNLIFCNEGTKVIDIFAPEWVNPCYWILSSINNLKYAYLIGEQHLAKSSTFNKGANIKVDPAKLDLLIKKLIYD